MSSSADTIAISLALCGSAILSALWILRSTRLSLGIPFAYLALLFIEHLPGAYAHLVRSDLFTTTEFVADGVWQTAVASVCFVGGLAIARREQSKLLKSLNASQTLGRHNEISPLSRKFWVFCYSGGLFFVYGLTPLRDIPTLGALIEKGGSVWILGVMLALRHAFARGSVNSIAVWLGALSVYPLLTLILGGFLSFGTIAAVVALSVLSISITRFHHVLVGAVFAVFLMLTVFVNYFVARDQIRAVAWSDASFGARVETLLGVFSQIELLNFSNDAYADAVDQRLNQNYFAGLAANRLGGGMVDYRYFTSFFEALIAPIPRILWPDKPVLGGSGSIVRDMTGLPLSETTSWGVGQVMELYISFGWPSLILGFVVLGWLIGRLDLYAAFAERNGDVYTLFTCFMPAVALTQPIVSLVELSGGAFAAYLAAIAWSYGWSAWVERQSRAGRR